MLFLAVGQVYGFIIPFRNLVNLVVHNCRIGYLWIMFMHISLHTLAEIAKQVLDRCVLSDPEKVMNDNEFEVIFDYSLVEDHQEKTKRKTHQR